VPEPVLFDRYRLIEPAGRGGSAEVWRARDEETGEEVAVKRLHPVVFADETGRRRLRREFDALRALDEPHIVKVRDLQVGDREAGLVLDFVSGESLAQRLARQAAEGRPMTPLETVAIVDDIAAALGAAHAAGIVHRDVTPGNILLAPDGEARLTDFGIARASDDTEAVTATGLVMGTMRYLAPEQLRGGDSTPASDLHGLAATAYEMLAGQPAYAAATPVALVEAQAAGPPPIPGVPAEVDAVVRRGLAVDPSERPPDVATFAKALAAAVAASVADPAADSAAAYAIDEPTTAMRSEDPDPTTLIGVASPSRAAEVHGPPPSPAMVRNSVALPEHLDAARRSARSAPRRGRRLPPAPVALAIGLLMAFGLLAAAASLDRAGTGGPLGSAAGPSGVVAKESSPTPTRRPTAAPPKDAGKGKGEGKGKGHEH